MLISPVSSSLSETIKILAKILIFLLTCLRVGFVRSFVFISKTTRLNFTKFSVHTNYGRSSFLLWRRCKLAIRNVLPVLWITSSFHSVGPMARRVYA